MRHTVSKDREGLTFVQIRGVHHVTGSAELVGEGQATARQSLGVMEEHHFSHGGTLAELDTP